MPEREAIAMWRTRLRWRLRGAWQWPTFAVITVVDAVLLATLPFTGGGAAFFPALLMAGFLNILLVAVVAPALGALLRRRCRGLPRDVAADYGGTAALVAVALALAVGGVAHRPAVAAAEDDLRAAVEAAQRYVAHQGPREYQAGLAAGDTWRQSETLYRTCFPGPDPDRNLCVIVRTDEGAPIVRRDPDMSPNAVVAGPLNPGRISR